MDNDDVWKQHDRMYPPRPRWMADPADLVRRVGETLYGADWRLHLPTSIPTDRTRLRERHRTDLLRMLDEQRDVLTRIRRLVQKQWRWPEG